MKKLLALTYYLFSINISYGQCYFHKSYAGETSSLNVYDVAVSICERSNGDIVICGDSDAFPYGALAIKTNNCGDTIWKNIYNINNSGGYFNKVIAYENYLVLVGSVSDQLENATDCFIIIINNNGDTLWQKVIDAGYNDRGEDVLPTPDGGFMIGGYYNDTVPNRVFLAKTDSLGNLQWVKTYGSDSNYHYITNMVNTPDGGYAISGRLEKFSNNNTVVERDLFIIKTDSAGNFQWEQNYLRPRPQGQGFITATADSGLLLTGFTFIPNMQGANAWAVKTDGNGDIEWEYEYTSPVLIASTFKKSIQLPGGSYLLSGSRTNTVTNGYDAWLVKLSNTGNFLWEKQYSYWDSTSHNYAEDMLLTRDGDIAITGYIIPVGLNLPNGNDAFILKVDTCGYLDSPNINASFAYSFATGNQITFTNQSQHYCKSLWHFGDGDSSYAKNPQHTYTDTGTYTIMLITYAGNSTDTTYQIINITTTGITPLSRGEGPGVRLFPNPATDEIRIEIQNIKFKIQNVVLYDVTGRKVPLAGEHGSASEGGKGDEVILNIQGFPKGLYFINITLSNDEQVIKKVIIH